MPTVTAAAGGSIPSSTTSVRQQLAEICSSDVALLPFVFDVGLHRRGCAIVRRHALLSETKFSIPNGPGPVLPNRRY